jgi:flagellar biosynthesis GTPase FlhF
MSTLTQPHTNGHDRELNGVRTYRGRKLEDLIPQIRAELGPDAIILRQREGLMGGVGGFFAQKCVEVDAQAGGEREPQPRIDIYDEDEPVNGWDDGLEDFVADAAPNPAPSVLDQTPELPALEPPKPVAAEPIQPPIAETIQQPFAEPIQQPFAEPIQPPFAEPIQPPAEPAARWAQEADAFVTPPGVGGDPINVDPIVPPAPFAPATPAGEDLTAESFVSRLEQAAAHVDIDELVKLVTTGRVIANAAPAPAVPAPAPTPAPAPAPATAPEAAAPAPAPAPAPEVAAPAALPSLDGDPLAPATPEPIIQNARAGGDPISVPPAASPWVSKQASGPDANEAAAVVAELTAQGISESWAEQLLVAASAHRSPLSKGSLRDAVRATLAAIIPAPAPLPPSGAAVAFVGAGGAGKTRCAAALATAYAKGSTLAASVVSLGSDDWGGDLKELLRGQNVWVMGAANGAEAGPPVQHGRDGGLVVLDTAAATPRDPATVDALAAELRSLSLDAVYIAVPATFSVHAARKLIDGFATLGADGIVVTHADEADQLGIAAEISQISGMPVAYIHEGLELEGALSAADPSALAARLLP